MEYFKQCTKPPCPHKNEFLPPIKYPISHAYAHLSHLDETLSNKERRTCFDPLGIIITLHSTSFGRMCHTTIHTSSLSPLESCWALACSRFWRPWAPGGPDAPAARGGSPTGVLLSRGWAHRTWPAGTPSTHRSQSTSSEMVKINMVVSVKFRDRRCQI